MDNKDHVRLVMYFADRFAREYGIEYLSERKDFILASQIVKLISLEEAQSLVDVMFETDDKFIMNANKTIGLLRSQLNALRQIKAKSQPRVMEDME